MKFKITSTAMSDQGLQCLLLTKPFLDASDDSKMDMVQFRMCGKQLRCPNI